jgi:hypothetical protein
MEQLYCVHCKKTYRVDTEAIRLMQHSGKRIVKDAQAYRFEEGCFFKTLAALKRQQPRR